MTHLCTSAPAPFDLALPVLPHGKTPSNNGGPTCTYNARVRYAFDRFFTTLYRDEALDRNAYIDRLIALYRKHGHPKADELPARKWRVPELRPSWMTFAESRPHPVGVER